MFHRKRIKLAIVAILVLLLTAALAPAAAAQVPGDVGTGGPPPADTGGDDTGDTGGTTPLPGNGNGGNGGTTPLPGNGNGNGGNGGTTPLPGNGNGNGGNGNGNGDMMMGPPANWPPPNAIVRHAATPIQISSLEGGLQVYFIGADGVATNGPLLATLSKLAEMHPDGAAVELFSGTNPGTGKPVTIQYLPGAMLLHVNTFYADKPPHDYNKAYIFTVDADHSVNHERW